MLHCFVSYRVTKPHFTPYMQIHLFFLKLKKFERSDILFHAVICLLQVLYLTYVPIPLLQLLLLFYSCLYRTYDHQLVVDNETNCALSPNINWVVNFYFLGVVVLGYLVYYNNITKTFIMILHFSNVD